MRLLLDLELEEVRDLLARHRYAGQIGEPGWGSIDDDETRLGRRLQQRPPGGMPAFQADPRVGPARVEARLYFDRYDATLDRQSDSGIDKSYLYISDAMDVVFIRGAGEIELLVSTTNRENIRRYLRPALETLDPKNGSSGSIVKVGRAQGNVDNDLFLWVLARYNGDRSLTAEVMLENVKGFATQDSDDRPTRMLRECIISRRAVQACITEVNAKYGPIKFKVSDDISEFIVSVELHVDGSFAVQRTESRYNATVDIAEKDFGRVVIDDVAFSLLPRLEAAHKGDLAWHTSGREEFLQQARDLLK